MEDLIDCYQVTHLVRLYRSDGLLPIGWWEFRVEGKVLLSIRYQTPVLHGSTLVRKRNVIYRGKGSFATQFQSVHPHRARVFNYRSSSSRVNCARTSYRLLPSDPSRVTVLIRCPVSHRPMRARRRRLIFLLRRWSGPNSPWLHPCSETQCDLQRQMLIFSLFSLQLPAMC